MKNLTIIIPIVTVEEELLTKAINSIKQQKPKTNIKTILVYPESISSEVDALILPDFVDRLVNRGGTLFSEQINFAVENVNTEYFSILEFDDEFSKIYFKNVKQYLKEYKDVSVFLSMIAEVDSDSTLIKLTNDFVWSKNFIQNDEFGYLTHELLTEFSYFFLSGSIIKTEDFIEVGKLKSKFDITCVYEFLLRATYNTKKVFVIPKIGYLHLTDRDGSATKQFSVKYNKKQIEEQFSEAKRDFMFN